MEVRNCVGCGYCCLTAMCFSGQKRLGLHRRCPALTWSDDDSRYYCQLALEDIRFAREVYVGAGCCSGLNTWRREVKNRG